MTLGKKLRGLTKSELEYVREAVNLTEDEEMVFDQLVKGRSIVAIANNCMISTSTVSNRIRDIKDKYERI